MNNNYLEVIDDSVVMRPDVFMALMKKYRYHKNVKYGFSPKHVKDIEDFRKSQGLSKGESLIPSNLYSLPVEWNSEVTFVK